MLKGLPSKNNKNIINIYGAAHKFLELIWGSLKSTHLRFKLGLSSSRFLAGFWQSGVRVVHELAQFIVIFIF